MQEPPTSGRKFLKMGNEMVVTDQTMIDFQTAFDSPNPLRELRRVVGAQMHVRGVPRSVLLSALDEQRLRYRAAGRESEEDTVTEVMEFLDGWCAPAARL